MASTNNAIEFVDTSLEKLSQLFQELVEGVRQQHEAETQEQQIQAAQRSTEICRALFSPTEIREGIQSVVRRRDDLVELIFAIEEREARIRKTVVNAEKIARSYAAFAKNLKSSIECAMLELGLQRIEGYIHRFAIHKQSDLLRILDESQIPAEYFEERTVIERVLNKDKLVADLQTGKEIPGAFWETNRRRLDVK